MVARLAVSELIGEEPAKKTKDNLYCFEHGVFLASGDPATLYYRFQADSATIERLTDILELKETSMDFRNVYDTDPSWWKVGKRVRPSHMLEPGENYFFIAASSYENNLGAGIWIDHDNGYVFISKTVDIKELRW